MGDSETETEYKQRFIERVAAARQATGKKQWQVAELLSISQDKYKQYETRSLLPHYLMGRFCLITNVDPDWLLTGRGKKPIKALHAVASEPAPTAKPRRSRAKRVA